MRKLLCTVSLLVSIIMLSACGAETNKIAIEDYEWKMREAIKNDIESAQGEDKLASSKSLQQVVAVGTKDDLYPNAKIVDIILTAKDEKITLVDKTNNKTYNGVYKLVKKTSDGYDYEITIDGKSGYATVSPTQYDAGTEIPTLPINLGDYSIYFIPTEK